MSDSDNDKKLDELLELVRKAPALNGGFDKLSDAVESIKETNIKVLYELQMLKVGQEGHSRKIDVMHNSLYDPDDGLYQRVTSTIADNKAQEKHIARTETKVEEIKETQEEIVKKVDTIQEKHAALERIAGEDLQELRTAIATRKNMMRAFWVFLSAAIAGIANFLWEVLPHLF